MAVQSRRFPISRSRSVKRTFWLDPDTYEKLMRIRDARLRSRRRLTFWASRVTYTTILIDVLHQFLKRHGPNIPRRRRISISLSSKAALILRSGAMKLGINETDILNTAIREYDEKLGSQELEARTRRLVIGDIIGPGSATPAHSSKPI